MTNEEIVKRQDRLETDRKVAEASWQDIERYVLPLSGKFFNWNDTAGSVSFNTRDVWDSTAPIGAERMASFFWASLCSPMLYWLDITFPAPGVEKDAEAQRWLQDSTRLVYSTLAASNFAMEMATGMLNWVGYGNAALTQEPVDPDTWRGYEFTNRPLRSIVFEEDHRGRVRRFFAKFNWTPSQIVEKFTRDGKYDGPAWILEADQAGKTEPETVIYAVYPREGAKPMTLGERVRAPENRPYAYRYVLARTKETLGKEGGLYEMNNYLMRYNRAEGSPWGFGPALLALPTVKLLNALQEEIVLAAGKSVDPASLVEERGLIGDLDLERGGMTVVRDPTKSVVPYESKARFDVSDNLLERQQMMVRKYFREDDIGLKSSPAMTATEVMQRVTLVNRLFGAQVMRAQNDAFDPVVQNTFNGLMREGQIPPPPAIIQEMAAKGYGLRISYRGPFSRAQRDDDVAAIERLMTAASAGMKLGFQDITDEFKYVEGLKSMADMLGTPAGMWFTRAEAAQNRQKRMAMQEAAAKAQVAKTAAEADRAQAGAESLAQGA